MIYKNFNLILEIVRGPGGRKLNDRPEKGLHHVRVMSRCVPLASVCPNCHGVVLCQVYTLFTLSTKISPKLLRLLHQIQDPAIDVLWMVSFFQFFFSMIIKLLTFFRRFPSPYPHSVFCFSEEPSQVTLYQLQTRRN